MSKFVSKSGVIIVKKKVRELLWRSREIDFLGEVV